MARVRTETTTVREGDSSELEEGAPPTAPVVEDEEIRDLVELGGGASSANRWQVKCIAPADKVGFCTEYPAGEINLTRIVEEFGPGRYELRCIDPRGKFVTQRTIQLRAKVGAGVTPTAPVSPLNDPMVQMLLASQKEQSAMLMAVLGKAFERPAPLIADPLEMLVKLKQLMPEQKQTSEMDLFLKGLEFGRDMGGSGETGIMDLIGQGIKHVGPLLSNAAQSNGAAIPDQPSVRALPPQSAPRPIGDVRAENSARTPTHSTAPETSRETNPMLQTLNWLKKQTDALVFQASRQKSPQLYAEVFLDNLPNFLAVNEVHARFKEPGAIAQLSQLNPNVSTFSEWFEIFRQSVIELIESEMQAEAPNPPTDTGA